ncbi:MAG: 50S ribosomal protein L7/L12 [Desulfurivibrionaceae bacterium]
MSVTKDDVIEFISNMSVLELSELVKEMEEKFGVSAAAPTAVAAAPAGGEAAEGGEAEAKTEFDVVLTSGGDKKINVIKEVRTITSLGLKEAKAMVEGAPAPIKEGVAKEEADEIKSKIEAAGGSVEIK